MQALTSLSSKTNGLSEREEVRERVRLTGDRERERNVCSEDIYVCVHVLYMHLFAHSFFEPPLRIVLCQYLSPNIYVVFLAYFLSVWVCGCVVFRKLLYHPLL